MINNRQGGRRRGRGGGGGGPPRSSNPGPGNRQDNRQRGNAAQLLEKYKGMARDAQMQGDRVQTETYLQYADHYFRVLNESRARFEEQRPRQRDDYDGEDDYHDNEASRDLNERDGGEREANDRDGGERDPGERYAEENEGREDEPRREREPRAGRAPRPERQARPERDDGNGGYRATTARRPRTPRPVEADEDEGGGERISLDVLPPAISAANEEEPARPARARRPRRPREDEDIAPAA
ncbi:MAG TPA: DUF4167 domain-containing protein [Allosphingosinicella sp.]|nr:DUF4167 domain-containing protein [Allosphingosinicella sp.]